MRRQLMPGHMTGGQRLPGEEHMHGDDGVKACEVPASLIHSRVECPIRQGKCE